MQDKNTEYNTNNIKFLTIISYSKKAKDRAKYKSDKIKLKYNLTKEAKNVFYASKEWSELRSWVFENYNNVCFCCGLKNNLEVDHIQPISKFPHNSLKAKNLQILCRNCNLMKSNKTSRRFRTGIHKNKLFNIPENIKILGKFNYWDKFFPPIVKPIEVMLKD